MTSVAKEKKKTPNHLNSIFGGQVSIKLEDGRTMLVHKWSMRKALSMSEAIQDILSQIFSVLGGDTAVESDGKITFSAKDFIAAIPKAINSCAVSLAEVIAGSVTTLDGEKITSDEVLDTFTIEDFPSAVISVAELNLSESAVGKWQKIVTGQILSLT